MKTTLRQKPFCTVFMMYHTQPKNRPNGQNFYTLWPPKEGVVNFADARGSPPEETGRFHRGLQLRLLCWWSSTGEKADRLTCGFFAVFFFSGMESHYPRKKMGIFGTNHYNDPYEPHQFFNGTKWGFLMYHSPGSPTVQPPFFLKVGFRVPPLFW